MWGYTPYPPTMSPSGLSIYLRSSHLRYVYAYDSHSRWWRLRPSSDDEWDAPLRRHPDAWGVDGWDRRLGVGLALLRSRRECAGDVYLLSPLPPNGGFTFVCSLWVFIYASYPRCLRCADCSSTSRSTSIPDGSTAVHSWEWYRDSLCSLVGAFLSDVFYKYSYALSVESSYRLRYRRTYSVYSRAYWRSSSCNAGWHLLPKLRLRLYGYSRIMIAPNGAFFFLLLQPDGRTDRTSAP